MDYYYEKLSLGEKKQYKIVLEAVRNKTRNIKLLGGLSQKSLESIIKALSYDHPELYLADFRQYSYINTPISTTLCISYFESGKVGGKSRVLDADQKLNQIISSCNINGNDSDKLKYRKIHNYLIKNIKYNYTALGNADGFPFAYNACGVLFEGAAVCEGIAKTFKLIADKIGLDAIVVEGRSSLEQVGENVPHAWNIIKLNDNYYHVDVTWDLNLSQFCKHKRYDYFLVPDEWIRKDHIFSGLPVCHDEKETFFFGRNCLICSNDDLKTFYSNNMNAKAKCLYFKINSENNNLASEETVVKTLQGWIIKSGRLSYSISMANNKNQGVFFIRID